MANRKLSDQDKLEIRRLHKQGISITALAANYEVSYNTIRRVVNPELYAQQLKKTAQYQKENLQQIYEKNKMSLRSYYIQFHRNHDAEIIKHLDAQENVTQYIRDLVTEDMNKK